MVQAARGVQRDRLVVLDGLVVPGGVQVRHLHEEARDEGLADVDVVVLGGELVRRQRQLEPRHQPSELLADGVARLEGARVEEVVVRPRPVLAVALPGVVGVEHSEVVPIHVREPRLRLVRGALGGLWPHEDVRRRQHRDDREHLVGAVVLGARHQHLGKLGVERELRHRRAQLRQVAVVVERAKVVEELERAHERLGRRRVHEVEVHQIVDAQLLEREHNAPQVAPQHLRVCLLLELLMERLLGVEAEALARPRAPCPPCPLVRARLGDGRDEERLDADARVVHLLLREARVDHVHDTVDGERGLGDVGGDHDLASGRAPLHLERRRGVEHLLLVCRGQRGVERDALHWPHLRAALPLQLRCDLGTRLLDLVLAREEEEDVALGLREVDLHGRADRRLEIVPLRLLGVEDFDRERAARDVNARAVVEVPLELAGIEGRGHDDELQVRPLAHHLLDQPEQNVGRHRTLMGLVKDDALVSLQQRVVHRLAEKHAVCHVPQERCRSRQVLETDRVPDLLP
mmetsp:Transcript_48960/g.116583  ORF Transcript_48960/g.116583 Transcript_48960/m.116583 type:complete len:518 (+) Transcript_48960:640-2193(+)